MLTLSKSLFLFKPADFLILLSALLFTGWLYVTFWFDHGHQGQADRLLIQYAENDPVEYPLSKAQIISIDGHIGTTLIEIKQGRARFIHSSCRNQFCVFHGWLSVAGDTTACLPNRISISLQGSRNDFDAIAGGQ